MKFAGMFLIAVLAASGAAADDVDALKERYYADRPVCRSIEESTTEEQALAACESMEAIAKTLTADGYCWDASEFIWDKCPLTN